MGTINELIEFLPPLKEKRNPTSAAIIGALTGGVGLGIYFKSFIDFLMPIGVVALAFVAFNEIGAIGGAAVAGLYGYFRATTSNNKLESNS